MKTTCLFLLVGLYLSFAMPLKAQNGAFTYQGRLSDNGVPANGSFDLQFRLRDAATNGNQIGGTVDVSPISVSNGVFSVLLSFGIEAFNGDPRWLEISVRTNGAVTPHILLNPSQPITPIPYAWHAAKAASAGVAASLGKSVV